MEPKTAGSTGTESAGRRGNLVLILARTLRDAIRRGDFAIGERMPSEAELTALHGVSRTVVREAIAALRLEGVVEARQGAGVFVIANPAGAAAPFRDVDPDKLSSILEILELRAAVEIEAAGLAALRHSPAQEEDLYRKLDDIDARMAAGEPASEADFAFHLSIAEATSNPRFRQFLEMLGSEAIPRRRLEPGRSEPADAAYLAMLQSEHRQVADAIAAGDAEAARHAMRIHLQGSQKRYRRMLREA
ncbi:FadR/GntR family transcriptional regulator [Zhengella sp. ZM62]|uniref:FadR/GntR family transcriptional regulator n=1 Tax=Zhengella sedimenti TaxID=3390035 RepID=UPI00397470A3